MDADEIRTLLGDNIFERAKKYRKRIQQSTCTVNADGVRHISAMVQGSGGSYYYTQAWLRENGSFVSASCSCPYNQNGEGTYCKHIGALLLDDAEKNAPAPAAKPDAIPGVVRGAAGLAPEPARRDSYASGLEMLFGKSGTAKRRCRITRPAGCWIPTRKQPLKTLAWTRPPSAPALPIWNRS